MTRPKKSPFAELHSLSKTASLLSSIQGLLEWDQETYMPRDAIHLRSEQLEELASLAHKQRTGKRFVKALSALIDIKTGELVDPTLSSAQSAALREWRRDYLRAQKLPNSFVKTFAQTVSQSQHAWALAKRHSDFSQFSPFLEKILYLCRKKADILGFQQHPYDALLDLYEPELNTASIAPLFAKLKLSLTSLLKNITSSPQIPSDFLSSFCAPEKQMEFGKFLLSSMGFDEHSSRLDISSHPFCFGAHPKDTRMTTRILPEQLMSNIFSVIHEGGHGLYNSGLPFQEYGSPLCESASLGIDESQSRWWETLIGRSFPFWQHFYPLLQKTFPSFQAIPLEDFYRAINQVKPSLIRVEADEVTYSLHVIVRYEIEKALIEGSLKVKEIPEAWNDKMRTYLGIAPQYDADGCLQDIHWSMGSFGYFPTYTLGNLYASQFFLAFEKDHPTWKEKVRKGELGFIRSWLHEKIHRYGRQYTPEKIAERVTGKPLSEQPYVNYLEKKYKELYRF